MDTCYCDTETTSLREPHLPGGRRTWEVALVRVPEDPAKRVEATWLQIVDVDLTHADPVSLNIGRFYERFSRREGERHYGGPPAADLGVFDGGILPGMASTRTLTLAGVTEADAARKIEKLTRGAVLAGSNPGFDEANFADLLGRHQLPAGGWFHHHRDVPNVATGWLRAMATTAMMIDPQHWPAFPPGAVDGYQTWDGASYSTRVISEACGVPEPADRHSAWADTVWMYQIDQVIRGQVRQPATVSGG